MTEMAEISGSFRHRFFVFVPSFCNFVTQFYHFSRYLKVKLCVDCIYVAFAVSDLPRNQLDPRSCIQISTIFDREGNCNY